MAEILTAEQIGQHWDRNAVTCDNCGAQVMARGGTRGDHNGVSVSEGEEETLCGFCAGEELALAEKERESILAEVQANLHAEKIARNDAEVLFRSQLATSEAARVKDAELIRVKWTDDVLRLTQERDAAIKRAEELEAERDRFKSAFYASENTAAERVESITAALERHNGELRAALNKIVKNRVDDGGECRGECLNEECSECVARKALTSVPVEPQGHGIFDPAKMEANSLAVAAMPDWVKGSPTNTREPQGEPPAEPIRVGDTVRHHLGQASVVSVVHPTIHESFAELSDGHRKPLSQLERVEPLSTADKADLGGSFYQPKSIAELALEQNVKPIESISELRGIWPLDEPDPDSPTGTAGDPVWSDIVHELKRCIKNENDDIPCCDVAWGYFIARSEHYTRADVEFPFEPPPEFVIAWDCCEESDTDHPTGTADDHIPRETVEAIEPDPNCKRCGGSGEFINWDARWPCYCVRGSSAGIKVLPPACPNCAGMRKALEESIDPLTVLSEMFEKGYERAMQDNAVDAAVYFNGMEGMVNKALASAKAQLESGK